ncbi:hypothetical protein GCM10017673_25980 [Streptosporangium violaceochromogenes]|nr:hypothetical protein GCM10017673_25980 [Streptosporangium violaceochromogenes]
MRDSVMPKIRPMLSVDMEDYGGRNAAQQNEAQRGLRHVLHTATRGARLALDEWAVQWSGDGGFAVLPGQTPVRTLAETFVQELDVALATHNGRPRPEPWTRLRLRLALHEGPVRTDGATGVPGSPAVQVNRLADADAARTALASCQGANLVVIVSERIFDDYLTDGYGRLSPAEFRQVRVRGKRKETYLAYLYVPGCDLYTVPALDPFDPTARNEAVPTPGGPPAPETPRARSIVYGSAHTISDSVVNETHQGGFTIGDITLKRR